MSSLEEKGKELYFKNLDGLRFLCFLSVFFFHSFHTEFIELKESSIYYFIKTHLFGNGNIGVNFFFVLSGFLITLLLINEKNANGQINIKFFWIRRVLRIWPLFYLCFFFGFILFPLFKEFFGGVSNETADPIYYLTFMNNFDFIAKGLPDASVLGVLWSVAIEEQFYLAWPLVIFIFPVRNLWIPFALVITSSLCFRAIYDSALLNEYHTISCIGDMAIGATGAWLVSISEKFKNYISSLSKLSIACIYFILILIFFFRDDFMFANYGFRIFERMLIAVVILFVILEQTFAQHSFFKMSNFKRISQLGLITYGLYCLHFIGILTITTITKKLMINTQLWQVLLLETSLALMLTIIFAKISYKYIEGPFLTLKNKFSYLKK